MLVNYASAIRLNFSYADAGDFERGLNILARLIAQHIPVGSG